MLKSISNLGKTLNKSDQRSITGGGKKPCDKFNEFLDKRGFCVQIIPHDNTPKRN